MRRDARAPDVNQSSRQKARGRQNSKGRKIGEGQTPRMNQRLRRIALVMTRGILVWFSRDFGILGWDWKNTPFPAICRGDGMQDGRTRMFTWLPPPIVQSWGGGGERRTVCHSMMDGSFLLLDTYSEKSLVALRICFRPLS